MTTVWAADGPDEVINEVFTSVSDAVQTVIFYSVPVFGVDFPLVVGWLAFAAIFFTVYFRGINVRGFRHAIGLVKGDYTHPDEVGEVSHFQALATAVSGTVGLGNIAGVAVAITIGGPGATFWMIVAGLLSMSTKFTECTLGVKYRRENADGSVSGGPMYYLSRGLAEQGKVRLGKFLAVAFAIFCIFGSLGGGNAFQSNQAFAQMRDVTGGDDGLLGGSAAGVVFGVILAIVVGVVIIGGIKRIGKVTEKLVPFMAVFYVTACFIVIFGNLGSVPEAFGLIIGGAFSPEGITGGVIGVLITGFQRAAFSNEAGLGSAPIAHSAVKTRRPVSEGFVALLEPFIDTVIVCTMTALAIVVAAPQFYLDAQATVADGGDAPDGVVVTSSAFGSVVSWFPNVLALAVALFAFSTLLTWSYYGLKAWSTLFGRSPVSEITFKVIFCLFTVVGTVLNFSEVLNFADAMLFLCAFVNLAGVYILMPVVKKEMQSFLAERRNGTLMETPPEERVSS